MLNAVVVVLEDQRWPFDEQEMTLADYFMIKAATGLGRIAFLNGLLEEEPAALQALVWFLRRRAEPGLALESVDFRPSALSYEPVVEPEVDAGPPSLPEAAAPNATSGSSETSTSTSSPDGAASEPVTSTI